MPTDDPLQKVESLLDYLITADVVPNTYGTVCAIRDALERIDAVALPADGIDRLHRVLTTIEENRALFAIPETHVIDGVYRAAGRLRKKVGS